MRALAERMDKILTLTAAAQHFRQLPKDKQTSTARGWDQLAACLTIFIGIFESSPSIFSRG